jgi:hypothetical protein
MNSKQLCIRMDPGFYDALTRRAREEGRSLGGQVRWEVLNSWYLRMGQDSDELGMDADNGIDRPVDGSAAQGGALK